MSKINIITSIIVLLHLFVACLNAGGNDCSTGVNLREQVSKFQNKLKKVDVPCDTCDLAVYATREYIDDNNKTEKEIEEIVKVFCYKLKIEDENVCESIVMEYEHLFFYLIANKQISSKFVCGVIGLCPPTLFPGWNVTLSPTPPVIPYPGPNPNNPSLYVLHLSDIHIDPLYTPGLAFDCGEPICCRPPNPPATPGAGPWGEYACDLPLALYENMLQWIAKNFPNLAYAIFTGDMPPHDVWNINQTSAVQADTLVSSTFKKFLPNVTLFPAVGNHEAVPVNEFAPVNVGGYWNISWLYEALADQWQSWLPADAVAQIRQTGYYSALSPDGVRIVSLNTNMGCNNENVFLEFPSAESADPDQMLHWLNATMFEAEQSGEMVYILKHIGPSLELCGADWWRNYLNIMDRYKNIIMGDFAGHTHQDIFSVAYKLASNSSVRPIVVTYFPGSAAAYSNNNPGFRIYEVDSVTKAIIDYTEYATNLTQANLQGYPTWMPIYSARSAYMLPDMSPSAWHNASLRMVHNETMLYEYWARNSKLAFQDKCDAQCLQGVLCNLWNIPPDTNNITICKL